MLGRILFQESNSATAQNQADLIKETANATGNKTFFDYAEKIIRGETTRTNSKKLAQWWCTFKHADGTLCQKTAPKQKMKLHLNHKPCHVRHASASYIQGHWIHMSQLSG